MQFPIKIQVAVDIQCTADSLQCTMLAKNRCESIYKLKIPLRFFPCGYTINAETKRPTEIPMAVWIIP